MRKRTTIFKQLIFNVVFPALIALIVLGILYMQQTLSIISVSNEKQSRIISDDIRQIHEMQDMAIRILDKQIDPVLENFSNILVNDIFSNTEHIEVADLKAIREQIGMNPENQDIYVINREGIVVNTTFDRDLGLNLFDFGEEHRELLESVREKKRFRSEQFSYENTTKRPKKYTYMPTRDGEYIIELGIYSVQADSLIDYVNNRMNDMTDLQSNIIAVDLFIGKDSPICLNGNSRIDSANLEAYRKVMESRGREIVEGRMGRIPTRTEFIFMNRQNTKLYKESVIRIISDTSPERKLLTKELLKFLFVFAITVSIVLVLLYKKTRVITDPIKKLVSNVNRITAGHMNERAEVVGNNEITSLSEQFNNMIAELESYYNELEQKVKERTAEVVAQKEEIEAQRDTLREQRNMLAKVNDSLQKAYYEIEDSIHYASRIQRAILPPDDYLKKVIPNAFFFYRPRDIVSGDFYWVASKNGKIVVSAVDCTGHGVPGAFMSIVGNNQLNYALNVEEETEPAKILKLLDEGVTTTLRQTKNESIQDGMDLAMVTIDKEARTVQYSGAFNPLILVRKGELIKYKADRIPIGGHILEIKKNFTNNEFTYEDGDMIYMYSDGYADQFGGEKGSKYLTGRFNKFLHSIADQPVEKQSELLELELKEWMGKEAQVDDILVIGIRL